MRTGVSALCALVLAVPAASEARTLAVGPGHAYAKPCQAIAVAKPGDVVRIDARGNGTYDGDVCASSVARLTIEGFNGRARVDARGRNANGKGTWVLAGPDTVVRNVELSGARVPDRNGAAIRLEGDGDLHLSNAYLHHNENGLLVTASSTRTRVVVERTELDQNGAGDGQSHNVYVARARSFAMRFSHSHRAKVGHLVKSRAQVNDISFNRLTGEGGTSSYELELPDGGAARVVGNVIQQGPTTENHALLSYAAESVRNPRSSLRVVHNTFVSDRPQGGTAIVIGAAASNARVDIASNLAVGHTRFVEPGGATPRLTRNCLPKDARFVAPAAFDFRLRPTSPCRDKATRKPPGGLPRRQYRYDLRGATRRTTGRAPDAGAFEAVAKRAGLRSLARM